MPWNKSLHLSGNYSYEFCLLLLLLLPDSLQWLYAWSDPIIMVDIFANKNLKHLEGTLLTNIKPMKTKQLFRLFQQWLLVSPQFSDRHCWISACHEDINNSDSHLLEHQGLLTIIHISHGPICICTKWQGTLTKGQETWLERAMPWAFPNIGIVTKTWIAQTKCHSHLLEHQGLL